MSMKNADTTNSNTAAQDGFEPEVTEEEIRAHLQQEVPGSSAQDVVTLLFIANGMSRVFRGESVI